MDNSKIFTLSEVAQHKFKKDCWFVINGRVLNVTQFLDEHPGGEEILLERAGKDATENFRAIGHSKAAKDSLLKYQVGVLEGHTIVQDSETDGDVSTKESTKKEMSAFVVKEDLIHKYASVLEFFVPLLVAGSYFVYRYITNFDQINS